MEYQEGNIYTEYAPLGDGCYIVTKIKEPYLFLYRLSMSNLEHSNQMVNDILKKKSLSVNDIFMGRISEMDKQGLFDGYLGKVSDRILEELQIICQRHYFYQKFVK